MFTLSTSPLRVSAHCSTSVVPALSAAPQSFTCMSRRSINAVLSRFLYVVLIGGAREIPLASTASPEFTVCTIQAITFKHSLNILSAPCRDPWLSNRLPALLHKLVLRLANRMDQHVRNICWSLVPAHLHSLVGCLFSQLSWGS